MINPTELDLQEEVVVRINRVSKVTSRGKRLRFSALVVIGDGNGYVGMGMGKANEVISAITKSKENAKQNLFKAPIILCGIVPLIIGALKRFCLAFSFDFVIAEITSFALPIPIPTYPLPSPITTNAENRNRFPLEVTLDTLLILTTTSSCKSSSVGFIIFITI
jgi:hypothetical protein